MRTVAFGFLAIFLVPSVSMARAMLDIKEDLYVFRKPVNSKPILILRAGQRVPVSQKRYGKNKQYRRVVFRLKGKRRGGYVRIKDLAAWRAADVGLDNGPAADFSPLVAGNGERPGYYGLALGALYQHQGASEVASENEQTFSVSKLGGLGFPISFFIDFSMNETWSLSTWASYRSLKTSGSAGIVLGNEVSSSSDFSRSQTQLGLGLGFKYYGEDSRFWYGGFVEMGKVLSSKLTITGQAEVEADASSIPLKFVLGSTIGYEWVLSDNWSLLPEMGIGLLVNGDPMAMTVHLLLPIGVAF